ncbi:YciI family protein [Streptomyces otsuchiensis]|uniref:YciI family protein n=1 Tax=Streptomyces otsuchiensis TaxID=2681388 RepID=UPI00103217A7|nr:YciI family protein [Streptomyces otsuchiensis]
MPRYLLSVYQPDGEPPPPEFLEPVVRALEAVEEEMRAAGARVFAAGLHAPGTATVVRADENGATTADGPHLAGEEHLGGFTVIEADDQHAAVEWGVKLARATTLPIEVRPVRHGSG